MASSIQEVDQAIAKINKGTDKKEELQMMLAPYANWDRFIMPAPMTIALLGQLILVSAESDFSLRDEKKEVQFTLLHYPDSFRACLVQVSNKGWGAFNTAHTNMDQIRLYSGNVDGHVRTAVKFLLKGSPQEVQLMLPNALNAIGNIANECLVLAESAEKEFIGVMDLVGELLEACTRAKGQYDEEYKKTEIAMEVLNANKESVEERKKEAERIKNDTMNQVKNAERGYKEAMDEIPTAGKLISLAVTDVFLGVVKQVGDIIPRMMGSTAAGKTGGRNPKKAEKESGNSEKYSSETSTQIQKAFDNVGQIKVETAKIKKLARGDKREGKPEWDNIGKNDGAEKIKITLQHLLKKIPKTVPEIDENVEKICIDSINICETLLSLQKSFTKDDENVKEMMSQAEQLERDVESAYSGLSMARGGNSLSNKSPHQASRQSGESEGTGLVSSAMQSAKFKTETAKQNLSESRERYERSCRESDERMKELGEILADLAKQKPKKLNLEAIRDTLLKGMKALGELRTEWGKLVQFFNMLSNLVKCCLESSLKQFVETSNTQMQLGAEMSETMRDVLFEQAFKANQIAYVVNSISGAYTEVSGKHLMDRITCLGKLISLDPVKDRQKIMEQREELHRGCGQAQAAIKVIANQKKRDIDQAFKNRIGRIESEVEAIMPKIPKAEIKEIEGQVEKAMNIKKAALQFKNMDDLV